MSARHEKMKSDVESIIDALVAPTSGISCDEAAQRISTIGADYLKGCAQFSGQSTGDNDEEDEDDEEDSYHGTSTPGVPRLFSNLWSAVIDRVHNAPVEDKAHHEHITRLVDLVGKVKGNLQPEGDEWLVADEKCGWQDLPLLGQTIRDVYNEPIDTTGFESSALLSQECQHAVAGASHLELRQSTNDPESNAVRLAKSRHQWLSLQSFISRLWRDCGCDNYALYAIWALRSALEDWPESPPACDAKCDSFEESPAYLAFQVEAAAIWISNTAPLMYKCTEVWGPNGNPDWSKRAGAPGKGGRRWDGVDGYDREHKRWQLWEDVLGEVVRWCDGAGKEQMQGWKVKDEAIRALDAMKKAEEQ